MIGSVLCRIGIVCIGGLIAGCGADYDDDPGAIPDAGVGQCALTIAVSPQYPTAFDEVIAEVQLSGNTVGFVSYQWAVTHDALPVDFVALNADVSRISFIADGDGVYRMAVSAVVDGVPCLDGSETINVAQPGAATMGYRLRLIPHHTANDSSLPEVPAQEIVRTVPIGVDYALGTVALREGVRVRGSLTGEDGASIVAQVRIRPSAQPQGALRDVATDSSGKFEVWLTEGLYDVLVVPQQANRASRWFRGVVAGYNAAWQLQLSAQKILSGMVLGPDGAPLAGAEVSARQEQTPAAIAVTGDDGRFAVPVYGDEVWGLSVVPSSIHSLPQLRATAIVFDSAEDNAWSDVTVRYAERWSSDVYTVSARAIDRTSESLAGVRATWVAREGGSDAGIVAFADGSEVALSAFVRTSALSGVDGGFPEIVLPGMDYDVVLVPPVPADDAEDGPNGAFDDGAVTVQRVSVFADTDAVELVLRAPSTLRGVVTVGAGEPVAGALVTALPQGLWAQAGRAGASATSDEDGKYSLAMAPLGSYELLVDGRLAGVRPSGLGAHRLSVTAPAAGQIKNVAALILPPTVQLSGRVILPGAAGGAAGVTVLASCADCAASDQPLAEAVTDISGDFVLSVPFDSALPNR